MRPIHASPSDPFEGIARVLSTILSGRALKFKHVFNSAESVVDLLLRQKYEKDIAFFHFDVSDFYMTGSSSHHRKNVLAMIGCKKVRPWAVDALDFLMQHQYVHSRFCDGDFIMNVGTGQGRIFSSSVATCSFLHSQEHHNYGIATRRFIRKHGIFTYIRYADNLFFICKHMTYLQDLESDFRDMQPYSITREEAGTNEVRNLDVFIFKGPEFPTTGQLCTQPLLKDRGRYVSPVSSHLQSTLTSWPASYIRHLACISSSESILRIARQVFLYGLKKSGYNDVQIQRYIDRSNYIILPYRAIPRESKTRSRFFLNVHFHPLWQQVKLASHLKMTLNSAPWRALHDYIEHDDQKPLLAVCWTLGTQAFGSSLLTWKPEDST